MLHICQCSPGCVNIRKVRKMQEWQLTLQESHQTVEAEVFGWDGRNFWSDNNFFSLGWRKKFYPAGRPRYIYCWPTVYRYQAAFSWVSWVSSNGSTSTSQQQNPAFAHPRSLRFAMWVCLTMGYTRKSSDWIGNMSINPEGLGVPWGTLFSDKPMFLMPCR